MENHLRVLDNQIMHGIVCHLAYSERSRQASVSSSNSHLAEDAAKMASMAKSPGKSQPKSSISTARRSPRIHRARDVRARKELDDLRAGDAARIQRIAEHKVTDCDLDMNEFLSGIRATSNLPTLAEEKWREMKKENHMKSRELQQEWEAGVYQPVKNALEDNVAKGFMHGSKSLRREFARKQIYDNDPIELPKISFNQEENFRRTAQSVILGKTWGYSGQLWGDHQQSQTPGSARPANDKDPNDVPDPTEVLLSATQTYLFRGTPPKAPTHLPQETLQDKTSRQPKDCPKVPEVPGLRPIASSRQKHVEGQVLKSSPRWVSVDVIPGKIQSLRMSSK